MGFRRKLAKRYPMDEVADSVLPWFYSKFLTDFHLGCKMNLTLYSTKLFLVREIFVCLFVCFLYHSYLSKTRIGHHTLNQVFSLGFLLLGRDT